MTIGSWLYTRITNSTSINIIIGTSTSTNYNCYPDVANYENIPAVVYSVLSQKTNKMFRSQIVSLKSIETTQDKCETLNGLVYNLFDDSTRTRIFEKSSDIKIESVGIVNNITSLWDDTNKTWFGVLDVRINYII
jgi:hypothetical protein